MTYPCARCNMDEGSPVCRQDQKCHNMPPAKQQAYAYRGPLPDCRTCTHHYLNIYENNACEEYAMCTNADRYQPLPPVRLWRTT